MIIFNKIFPWLESASARKKIVKKIENIMSNGVDSGLETMNGYMGLSIEQLQGLYKSTFEVKSSLEEKIKSSLFSITLGITIQALAVSLLFNDSIGQQPIVFRGVVFFIGMVSLFYLLMAGYYAIKAISEEIVIYNLTVNELSTDKPGEKKKAYAACIELNNHANTIRNNILSVTYRTIVNGLMLIVLFFTLVGGASFFVRESKAEKIEVDMRVQPYWNEIEYLKKDIKSFPYEKDIKIIEEINSTQNKMDEEINRKILTLEIKLEELRAKVSSMSVKNETE